MVQVRDQFHLRPDGQVDLEQWLQRLPVDLPQAERERLGAACRMVEGVRRSPATDPGDWARESDCFTAGLDIAVILAELQVGCDCLAAGVVYRAVREQRLPLEQVGATLGQPVATLVEGVLRMAAISQLRGASPGTCRVSGRISPRCRSAVMSSVYLLIGKRWTGENLAS